MEPLTFRVEEETHDTLKQEAEDVDTTLADHLRRIVEKRNRDETIRNEYETKHTEYEEKLDDLETEVERLKNEKRQILEQREEHTQLVKAVQDDRTLQQRKEQAGVVTRAKWFLVGMPDE